MEKDITQRKIKKKRHIVNKSRKPKNNKNVPYNGNRRDLFSTII